MTVEAVLFDCDGVLVDSEIVGLEDAAEFLRERGFDWGPEDLIRRFAGMRTDQFAADLRRAYDEILGRPSGDGEFDALLNGMIDARRARRHEMTIVPGALDMMERTAATSLALAVASSSAQVFLDDKIERYGFAPFFDGHVYSADHVEHGKPAPDIFLFAAERLGKRPADCLVIEDSVHGVTAGVTAGSPVWGFTGGGHCLSDHAERLEDAGAARVFSDHGTLAAALADIVKL